LGLLILQVIILVLYSSTQVSGTERTNVLLITVDTFRPDRLGAYGYKRGTSPFLDKIAEEGVLFENAISSSSWTTPGLLSVLTGLWAPTHAVDVRGKSLTPGTPTLASILRREGYASPDILYLSSIPNLQNLGLTQSYTHRDKYLPNGDQVLFRALEAYRDSTFFLYYHYRNLHLPYNPSPEFDRLYTPNGYDASGFIADKVDVIRKNVTIPLGSVVLNRQDEPWISGLYDGQIREMDETFFKPLVKHMKQLGLYGNTLLIVTADHGEELMDHGFIGHPSTSFKGSSFDEVLRIPLIMHGPGLPAGGRIQVQVQNVDILPTVLDLLDIPALESAQGQSLVQLIEGGEFEELPAFTETTPGGYQATPEMMKTRIRAMRTREWKLIHIHGPGEDEYALYDLRLDPDERKDVGDEHPEILGQMRSDLHKWVLSAQPRPGSKGPPAMSVLPPQEPIRVLFPADQQECSYADVGKSVSVRWTGIDEAGYVIEYRVGEGNYRLGGRMPVSGTSARYGPYTEEMWNMLSLYNPFSFRITADGAEEMASPWVTFTIRPTELGVPSGPFSASLTWAKFWWAEVLVLLTGLGAAVILLLSKVGALSPTDVVSGALFLAILGGIFRPFLLRLGRDRTVCWGVVILYTGMIFATLSHLPLVWRTLWSLTKGRIDYTGTGVTVLAGVGFLGFLFARCRRILPFLICFPVLGLYAYLLMELGRSPAERFHLAEYGVLSLLLFRAIRIDMPNTEAYLLGWGLAAALGCVDEGVQYLLPNRVFEWKDMGLNFLSSGLGMTVVALLQNAKEDDGA
jgi:arylsulfatase A-like enzyme